MLDEFTILKSLFGCIFSIHYIQGNSNLGITFNGLLISVKAHSICHFCFWWSEVILRLQKCVYKVKKLFKNGSGERTIHLMKTEQHLKNAKLMHQVHLITFFRVVYIKIFQFSKHKEFQIKTTF